MDDTAASARLSAITFRCFLETNSEPQGVNAARLWKYHRAGGFELQESFAACGRLATDQERFVQTQVELKLQDGVVTAIKTLDH